MPIILEKNLDNNQQRNYGKPIEEMFLINDQSFHSYFRIGSSEILIKTPLPSLYRNGIYSHIYVHSYTIPKHRQTQIPAKNLF